MRTSEGKEGSSEEDEVPVLDHKRMIDPSPVIWLTGCREKAVAPGSSPSAHPLRRADDAASYLPRRTGPGVVGLGHSPGGGGAPTPRRRPCDGAQCAGRDLQRPH